MFSNSLNLAYRLLKLSRAFLISNNLIYHRIKAWLSWITYSPTSIITRHSLILLRRAVVLLSKTSCLQNLSSQSNSLNIWIKVFQHRTLEISIFKVKPRCQGTCQTDSCRSKHITIKMTPTKACITTCLLLARMIISTQIQNNSSNTNRTMANLSTMNKDKTSQEKDNTILRCTLNQMAIVV